MRFSALCSVSLLCVGVVACSSKPDPNDPSQMQSAGTAYGQSGQYNNGQYPAGQYNPSGGSTVPNNQPQPTATAPAASGGGSATPIAPAAAAAATPLLQAMAASDVKGMQPEGGAFAGQFQAGQTLEQPFNISPGKCYSVIGVGVGITQLDITLQANQPIPGMPPIVLAQSNGSGSNATLGGGGNCFKNPLPVGGPGKVVVKATAGAGIALAQIFSK